MSYSAYVSSTSFTLVDPIEDSATAIRSLVHQEMDDYPIDLDEEVDGSWAISMLDTHEVGDSFAERLAKLVGAMSPYVTSAFEVMLRNCDTSSDDRDIVYFGGPDDRSIEIFKKLQTVAEVREMLRGIRLEESVIAQFDALMNTAIVGAEPDLERGPEFQRQRG